MLEKTGSKHADELRQQKGEQMDKRNKMNTKNNTVGDPTATLLSSLRNHLEAHPIDFRGDADSMIDFLYSFYISYVPVSTGVTREKYKAVAIEILKLITERDAARGVESHIVWLEGDGVPYNKDLEKVLNLVDELESTYGDEAFRTGFEAGARIAFEIMGEKSVGIVSTASCGSRYTDGEEEDVTGEDGGKGE